jgi:hypothetical protein
MTGITLSTIAEAVFEYVMTIYDKEMFIKELELCLI